MKRLGRTIGTCVAEYVLRRGPVMLLQENPKDASQSCFFRFDNLDREDA
jgi:hypothetical protein